MCRDSDVILILDLISKMGATNGAKFVNLTEVISGGKFVDSSGATNLANAPIESGTENGAKAVSDGHYGEESLTPEAKNITAGLRRIAPKPNPVAIGESAEDSRKRLGKIIIMNNSNEGAKKAKMIYAMQMAMKRNAMQLASTSQLGVFSPQSSLSMPQFGMCTP